MSSVHETAYPRCKPELTQQELEDIYTPSEEEMKFARRYARDIPARLFIINFLKTVQRLGYFAVLTDVPTPSIFFLAKCIGARSITQKELEEYE
ncbi:MAG: transposase [Solimicrobium sp.]|nr:transposase [Solimicrobium sp.]